MTTNVRTKFHGNLSIVCRNIELGSKWWTDRHRHPSSHADTVWLKTNQHKSAEYFSEDETQLAAFSPAPAHLGLKINTG